VIACVDFLRDVYGLDVTKGQTAFVRVAIDRVAIEDLEDEAERAAAEAMFGDLSEAPAGAWRTVVAAMGRDAGKTELGAGIALFKLLSVDVSRCGAGDIPRGIVVAPDLDTAKLTIERATARVQESPDLAELLVGEPSTYGLTLRRTDGRLVRFEVRAASRGGRSIRGRSIAVLVLDEAALFFGENYAVNDAEIVRAARPRLLRGGVVLMLSTPFAEDGLFFRLHSENREQAKTAIVASAPTLLMRDNDPELAELIEIERAEDPDNCAREFDAAFIAGGSSLFFDPEALAEAVRGFEPSRFTERAAGADVGLIRDSSTMAIAGRAYLPAHRVEEDGVTHLVPPSFKLALLDLEELRPQRGAPLKLSGVIAAFARVLARHRLSAFVADGHAREPAREYTTPRGLTIYAAPEGRDGKWATYSLLRKLISEGRLALPKNARLMAQLRAVRSEPMPGGGFKITSPRRTGQGHGDLVSALVLAIWAVTSVDRVVRRNLRHLAPA
jgi:hypothetical protein